MRLPVSPLPLSLGPSLPVPEPSQRSQILFIHPAVYSCAALSCHPMPSLSRRLDGAGGSGVHTSQGRAVRLRGQTSTVGETEPGSQRARGVDTLGGMVLLQRLGS